MIHLALARKWRPQRFEDVIGQRGVVETLKNAIATGRLAQAFIFAGPRGVGKTTTARILARALNCVNGPTPEPCGQCDACMEIAAGRDIDVLEIDGATYTGIDAVREVIVEPLAIAPMRDRYKIFIIDEVHRLSKQAFDALLKSIEEPPPYVKFLMATTDPQSVPDTIKSRSQVFELKALPFSAIREQLRQVTSNEGVAIDDAALALVARSAEGSMRDALSALDQILAFTSDRVTEADVSTVLGLIGRDVQFEIAEIVAREDPAAAFDVAGRVVEAGFDLRVVCRELARLMRDVMVVKIDASRASDREIAAEGEEPRLLALTTQFSREDLLRAFDLLSQAERDVRHSSHPRHQFEMALLKWIQLRKLTPLSELIATMDRPQAPGSRPQDPAPGPRPAAPAPTARAEVRPAAPQAPERPRAPGPRAQTEAVSEVRSSAPAPEVPELKSLLLSSIREQNKTFFGVVIAQAQKVDVDGATITFTFAPIHKMLRAQLDQKRAWLEGLAHAVSGRKMTVMTRESQPAAPAAAAGEDPATTRQADLRARAQAEPTVQAMLDVFGGEIEDVEEIQ